MEVYDLHIDDAEGHPVLRNSTFAEGSRGWFFTCDDHQIWRAKNCWLHLAVEFGFSGIAAFAWLFVVVLIGLLKVSWVNGSWPAFTVGWSLMGFLSMGFFGTLLDTPWITFLLILILAMGHGMGTTKNLTAKPTH